MAHLPKKPRKCCTKIKPELEVIAVIVVNFRYTGGSDGSSPTLPPLPPLPAPADSSKSSSAKVTLNAGALASQFRRHQEQQNNAVGGLRTPVGLDIGDPAAAAVNHSGSEASTPVAAAASGGNALSPLRPSNKKPPPPTRQMSSDPSCEISV